MKLSKMASRLIMVASAGLFAGVANSQDVSQLDFASIKAKCLELSGNQQLKPFKAIVTCRDVSYVWRQGPDQEQQLQNQREVGGGIRMKGFESPFAANPIQVNPSLTKCVTMAKVKVTVPSVDSELSCDDLNIIEDLTQFCLDEINRRTQEDPSLILEEDTGEMVSTCGAFAGLAQ